MAGRGRREDRKKWAGLKMSAKWLAQALILRSVHLMCLGVKPRGQLDRGEAGPAGGRTRRGAGPGGARTRTGQDQEEGRTIKSYRAKSNTKKLIQ